MVDMTEQLEKYYQNIDTNYEKIWEAKTKT
jgi:hypothetical protein